MPNLIKFQFLVCFKCLYNIKGGFTNYESAGHVTLMVEYSVSLAYGGFTWDFGSTHPVSSRSVGKGKY